MGKEKVVLGFSGGLDTTYCVKYLSLEKDYEVHSIIVNTGGFSDQELKEIEAHEAEALESEGIDEIGPQQSQSEELQKDLKSLDLELRPTALQQSLMSERGAIWSLKFKLDTLLMSGILDPKKSLVPGSGPSAERFADGARMRLWTAVLLPYQLGRLATYSALGSFAGGIGAAAACAWLAKICSVTGSIRIACSLNSRATEECCRTHRPSR